MAALTGALLALTAANTIQSAVGQRRQGEYQAGVADLNAGLADQQAKDAIGRGAESEALSRQGTRQLIGAQRAALGASGVDLESGSALDLQKDAAGLGELDALHIRNNAAREARGYKIDALNYRSRAETARTTSRNGATSTLLTGAANMAGLYQSRK
jgi:hypothetical protein